VATFSAADGSELSYRVLGDGAPVVCLPGGPMRDADYLGDLGGLAAHRQLIVLELRGTGRSPAPRDLADCRCDRLVADVEALREHLGVERIDLLGHSAGGNLAVLYATGHPDRVSRLLLVTPGLGVVGIDVDGAARREIVRAREGEPWFATAYAALEAVTAGSDRDEDWAAISPFFYGRWDATAQAHDAALNEQRNDEAARAYAAEGAFDPPATRAALARFDPPVLLLAGEYDVNTIPTAAAQYADMFPSADLVVQPASGHYPWLDDPDAFVAATSAFLESARR
jgi:proline iminopeptidase